MITIDYCKRFARYNRWQNQAVYAAASTLPDGTRKRNMGAFFRSIHGTLNHLMVADWLWMSRFDGEPVAVTALNQELYDDFDELRRHRSSTDDRIDRFIGTLSNEQLTRTFTYQRMSGNKAEVTMRFDAALVHFFNHQTHHRGQLTTLLMQCGIDVGVTDLPWLPADFASPVFGL